MAVAGGLHLLRQHLQPPANSPGGRGFLWTSQLSKPLHHPGSPHQTCTLSAGLSPWARCDGCWLHVTAPPHGLSSVAALWDTIQWVPWFPAKSTTNSPGTVGAGTVSVSSRPQPCSPAVVPGFVLAAPRRGGPTTLLGSGSQPSLSEMILEMSLRDGLSGNLPGPQVKQSPSCKLPCFFQPPCLQL